jgi:hypothetical protein
MKPQQIKIIAAFALTVNAASVNAALVTVTAEFNQLTMGAFASAAATFNNQLSVNGQSIDVCGGDPLCTNAINNPSSISASLTGNSVTFGYDQNLFPDARMNQFSFVGNTSDVAGAGPQNQFNLGTFTFTNGMFYPLVYLNLTLTTHSSDTALNNQVFNGRIRLESNQSLTFPRDPLVEADYFTVQDLAGNTLTSLGSGRVYDYNICPAGDPSAPDCNTGSVDLIGHINSLHLDGLANATGGAFLNSSTTSELAPVTVPVPPAAFLFGSGILGLWGARKKLNFKFAA